MATVAQEEAVPDLSAAYFKDSVSGGVHRAEDLLSRETLDSSDKKKIRIARSTFSTGISAHTESGKISIARRASWA